MTMTTEQRERNLKLAEALRSGEFQQGRGRLRFEDEYCCLGVACELFRRATDSGEWIEECELQRDLFVLGINEQSAYPPPPVFHWYGWQGGVPQIEVRGNTWNAVTHNDQGATFGEIADGFEKLAGL